MMGWVSLRPVSKRKIGLKEKGRGKKKRGMQEGHGRGKQYRLEPRGKTTSGPPVRETDAGG